MKRPTLLAAGSREASWGKDSGGGSLKVMVGGSPALYEALCPMRARRIRPKMRAPSSGARKGLTT